MTFFGATVSNLHWSIYWEMLLFQFRAQFIMIPSGRILSVLWYIALSTFLYRLNFEVFNYYRDIANWDDYSKVHLLFYNEKMLRAKVIFITWWVHFIKGWVIWNLFWMVRVRNNLHLSIWSVGILTYEPTLVSLTFTQLTQLGHLVLLLSQFLICEATRCILTLRRILIE